jgi:hypothetical protein
MTLFDWWGLYVGWDVGGYPHLALRIYCGSAQAQVGLLLLGCDWFFNATNARLKSSTPQGANRQGHVEALPHPRVVSGKGC